MSAPTANRSVGVAEIERAAETIRGPVRETPIVAAGEVSRRVGATVTLKTENLQRTGSFKVRGALNRIAAMSRDQLAGGVVAASAGNHAQGVAVAARAHRTRAVLYMPEAAPIAKIEAVRGYGGQVRLVPGTFDDAAAASREAAEREGLTLIHAFDDPIVLAGQGTVGLEIAAQAPRTSMVVVAVGGGALAAGTAIAIKDRLPAVRVIGVQSDVCAPYPPSLAARQPIGARSANTICDGIAVKRPGELTLPLVSEFVDEVVTVSDDDVAQAMVLLLERSKLVVEGAGAASVAALLAGKLEPPAGGEVCAVLSGGNVDAARLVECIRLGETAAGRRLAFSTVIPDRPGALAGLVGTVAGQGANVLDVVHLREGVDLHVRETGIRLVLQTDGAEHCERILAAVRAQGFAVRPESAE
ncbi:MAG: threonine ammonia-lyase [Solirubrobacterales bacterium]|nr:threonine ammonia-lyase [Solirubrobacterales bacterium]